MTSQSHDAPWKRPDDSAPPTQAPQARRQGKRPTSASLIDPEDDLPSDGYGGDFETTAIPRYDSSATQSSGMSAGMSLLDDPEPLPYCEPALAGRLPAVGPEEIGPDDFDDRVKAARRRGTQDLGLFLLRVGLGVVLIAHGLQKVFGWWGGLGLGGFRDSLAELGYQNAGILSFVAAGTELAAGALLVLGLFTPLAAAAALAYLINALLAAVAAQPESNYFLYFQSQGGHEYLIMLVVLAAGIVLAGPGRYGFDAGRGWARRPFVGSGLALVLGIGGGIAVWVLLNGANPVA
ncbi:MAG: DoxX family protein [Mycobacterium sp.]